MPRKMIVMRSSHVQHKRQQLKTLIKQFITEIDNCHQYNYIECALAWEVVDDLEEALERLEPPKDALEEFCDIRPDADECRIYDV